MANFYTYVKLIRASAKKILLVESDTEQGVFDRIDSITEKGGLMAFLCCEIQVGDEPKTLESIQAEEAAKKAGSKATQAKSTRQRKDPEPIVAAVSVSTRIRQRKDPEPYGVVEIPRTRSRRLAEEHHAN